MTARKADTTMAHLTPDARSALRALAKEDGRSITADLERLILREPKQRGLLAADQFGPRLVGRKGTIPRGTLRNGGGA